MESIGVFRSDSGRNRLFVTSSSPDKCYVGRIYPGPYRNDNTGRLELQMLKYGKSAEDVSSMNGQGVICGVLHCYMWRAAMELESIKTKGPILSKISRDIKVYYSTETDNTPVLLAIIRPDEKVSEIALSYLQQVYKGNLRAINMTYSAEKDAWIQTTVETTLCID